jgi:hypothetical protein
VQCAANEADRAAMLIVKGNRLTVGHRGFSPERCGQGRLILLWTKPARGCGGRSGVASSRPVTHRQPFATGVRSHAGGATRWLSPYTLGGDVVCECSTRDAQANRRQALVRARMACDTGKSSPGHASRVLEATDGAAGRWIAAAASCGARIRRVPEPSAHAGGGEQEVVRGSP